MNNGAFGEGFPYSNFHDLNMDWVIKIAKDFLDQYTHIQDVIAQGLVDLDDKTAEGLQSLADKYTELNNLLDQWYENHSEDIANELQDALDAISRDLATAVSTFNTMADRKAQETIASIPDDYTALSNKVEAIKQSVDVENVLSFFPKTSTTHNGVSYTWNTDGSCYVHGTASALSFCNIYSNSSSLPDEIKAGKTYYMEMHSPSSSRVNLQMYEMSGGSIVSTYTDSYDNDAEIQFNNNGIIIRLAVPSGTTVDTTVKPYLFTNEFSNRYLRSKLDKYVLMLTGTELDSLTESGWYIGTDTRTYGHNPFPGIAFLLRNTVKDNITFQIAINGENSTQDPVIKSRLKIGNGQFSSWSLTDEVYKMAVTETDANNCTEKGTYLFLSGNYTYYNTAYTGAHIMQTLPVKNVIYQIAYKWDCTEIKLRRALNGSWIDWQTLSGGGGSIVQEFYNYTNTYNVTATPTITTDTNAYLAPTGNTADRTSDIVTMLTQYGVCRLGKGNYYVKNLVMPQNTMISGSGSDTHIILLGTNTTDFAIQITDNCIIENVRVDGDTNDIQLSPNYTNRDGIRWTGSYSSNNNTHYRAILNNIYIYHFTGSGIRCNDTGPSSVACIMVSNIYIHNCNVGLNIAYRSEYGKFTNVRCGYNYYGIINNGGNNSFINCDVSGSRTGFLMDNSSSQSPNNGHGMCVGCTFNHIDDNTGTAIDILNIKNGFLFTGCQIHYGKTHIDSSNGILFNNCQFGLSNNISISSGAGIIFAECVFSVNPTITVVNNTTTRFQNCINLTTGADITHP